MLYVAEYRAFKREIHDLVFSLPDNCGNWTFIWERLHNWSRIFNSQGNSLDEIEIYNEINRKYFKKE